MQSKKSKKNKQSLPLSLVGLVLVVCIGVFFYVVSLANTSVDVRSKAQQADTFSLSSFVSGLSGPTAMAFASDGRLFVLEKQGRVRIIKNGQLLSTPFYTQSVTTNSERGLLGIAIDPGFATNRYVYLYYTRTQTPVKNRVVRIRASASNPDVAESGETILLDNIASDAGNHNGGALDIGNDGKLYVAVGDGGQTSANGQSLSTLSGKILRLNLDGTIPQDNPFVNQSGARGEIWAYGLRNPYTFAFNNAGVMYINDVGQSAFEEINVGTAGGNFGWPTCEGMCSHTGMISPLYAYGRTVGQAITGGLFLEGTQYGSAYEGDYIFGDYMAGWIKRRDRETGTVTDVIPDTSAPLDFDIGPDGVVYVLSYQGSVTRLIQSGNTNPTMTPTRTPTQTPVQTPTRTPTPSPTPMRTPTPTVMSPTVTPLPTAQDTPTPIKTITPTPRPIVIPDPPSWFSMLPQPLRDFLELLYVYVYVFRQSSDNAHILNGVFPTPTP